MPEQEMNNVENVETVENTQVIDTAVSESSKTTTAFVLGGVTATVIGAGVQLAVFVWRKIRGRKNRQQVEAHTKVVNLHEDEEDDFSEFDDVDESV